MPTITVYASDLGSLLGQEPSRALLEEVLPLAKCEVKDWEGNEVALEITADRPDMLSAEGIARVLKGYVGRERGFPPYSVERGGVEVRVEKGVEGVRPYIACAVVRGVSFTEASLAQLFQLQEKLHETFCRRRRKGSIGIYDLAKIKPPIRYRAVNPSQILFTPLGESRAMTGGEILDATEKGGEYGHIIRSFGRYPLLEDSEGMVLSLPPIINSEETKVTLESRDLFIDCTGLDEELVEGVVSIVSSSLWERGAKVEGVKVIYPHRTVWSGTLEGGIMDLELELVNRVSGLDLPLKTAVALLEKMRFRASPKGVGVIEVTIPPYRGDILHSIDLVEDVIIGYGYDKVLPAMPGTLTFGRELPRTRLARRARELMVGLGFQEVLSYLTTNPETQASKMGLGGLGLVEIANPMTKEYSALRKWLLPGLFHFLSQNLHVEYPQKIFECGDVVLRDLGVETKARQELRLAGVISDDKVSYEDIQAVVYSLLSSLKIGGRETRPLKHRSFISGRAASIRVGGRKTAILGEVNPEVLETFGLPHPTAAFELRLSALPQIR